jgi:hypothetical protein
MRINGFKRSFYSLNSNKKILLHERMQEEYKYAMEAIIKPEQNIQQISAEFSGPSCSLSPYTYNI